MRDALKDLAYQFWPGYAVGDGTVGVDASVVGGVSVGEAREAVVLHNADPSVLLDHAFRDIHSVVDDIVLADRVHADFGPRAFGCFNEPYIFRWGQGRGHLFFLPVVASHSSQHGKLYSEGRAPVPGARPY